MLFATWNSHRECAAGTHGALHLHTSAMQFDQFLNQCQADPRAFVRPSSGALDAMEAFEHSLAMLLRDSDARVADTQFHYAVHRLQCEVNLSLERELQGVGEKIQDDLLPHVAIHVYRLREWLACDRKPQTRVFHRRIERAGYF